MERDFDKFEEALKLAAETRQKLVSSLYREQSKDLGLLAENARLVYDKIIPEVRALVKNNRKFRENTRTTDDYHTITQTPQPTQRQIKDHWDEAVKNGYDPG